MSNSNKTLLQILVEELPKRGGWPAGAVAAVQDGDDPGLYIRRKIKFAGEGYSIYFKEGGNWSGFGIGLSWGRAASLSSDFAATELASDYATAIITREQYESAMAASQAVLGNNGWIVWHGGECPVDSDAIVEVKYRKPNPYQFNNDRAGDFSWSHDGVDGDIIAYRLPHPHEVKTAGIDVQRDAVKSNDAQLEADLNDCIGQPQEDIKTIRAEMLAVLNDTRLTMNLRAAMKLVDAFIDAGYRKQ